MALLQPNFARAPAASLADAAQELALCANMPAVIQGQGIIDAINECPWCADAAEPPVDAAASLLNHNRKPNSRVFPNPE